MARGGKKKKKGGAGPDRQSGVSARDQMTVSDSGVAVRRYGNDRGTSERRRHGAQEIVQTVEDNQRAYVAKALGTAERLCRNGTIGEALLAAADRFHEDFRAAAFDGLRAMPLERRAKGRVDDTGVMAARERVARVIRRLGGHDALPARAVWFVIGCDNSIKDWAQRERMGGGRALNQYVAKGILVGALVVLEVFYGKRG